MMLIGISGRAGAGKSTFRNYLAHAYTDLTHLDNIEVIPFALALKELAVSMGWRGKKDEKGRRLLQLLGTEVCRECLGEDYWIKKWLDRYTKALIAEKSIVIIDDIRFLNELQFLKAMGSTLIKITDRYDITVNAAHDSEQDLENVLFTRVIKNNSTLHALQLEAKLIMKGLLNWTY